MGIGGEGIRLAMRGAGLDRAGHTGAGHAVLAHVRGLRPRHDLLHWAVPARAHPSRAGPCMNQAKKRASGRVNGPAFMYYYNLAASPMWTTPGDSRIDSAANTWLQCLTLSGFSKFLTYITFLRHINNISSSIFTSSTGLPSKSFPYNSLQPLNIIFYP
jgi:hypothetical protein